MTYAHRNGETTPPIETGRYWFRGSIIGLDYEALTTVINVPEDGLLAWCEFDGEGWFQGIFSFNGQWWGPVVAPWEHPEAQS